MIWDILDYIVSLPGRLWCRLGLHSWYYYTSFMNSSNKNRYCVRKHCHIREEINHDNKLWNDRLWD